MTSEASSRAMVMSVSRPAEATCPVERPRTWTSCCSNIDTTSLGTTGGRTAVSSVADRRRASVFVGRSAVDRLNGVGTTELSSGESGTSSPDRSETGVLSPVQTRRSMSVMMPRRRVSSGRTVGSRALLLLISIPTQRRQSRAYRGRQTSRTRGEESVSDPCRSRSIGLKE